MKEIYVGDTVTINLNTNITVSGFGTLEIMYKKPDGIEGKWTAIIDPTNAKRILYTTTDDDIDQPGLWTVQARVSGGGSVLHGKFVNFQVLVPTDLMPS